MTVRDMVREWLKAHKCDGLSNSHAECGCELDDLMSCGELGMDCEASRRGDPPESAGEDCFDSWMYPVDIACKEADRTSKVEEFLKAMNATEEESQ